jgi:hypothetical protein
LAILNFLFANAENVGRDGRKSMNPEEKKEKKMKRGNLSIVML